MEAHRKRDAAEFGFVEGKVEAFAVRGVESDQGVFAIQITAIVAEVEGPHVGETVAGEVAVVTDHKAGAAVDLVALEADIAGGVDQEFRGAFDEFSSAAEAGRRQAFEAKG